MRRLGRSALFPAAAFAVHQLRFLLAYRGHASQVLARQGHAYLHSLAPWITLLLALGVGAFMWALGRAVAGQRTPRRYGVSLVGLWLVCTGCLVGIYVVQELLEGLLAAGHPPGFVGVLSYGGWWALPAAACVGLVLAAVFHGARWVLDALARRRRCESPPRRTPVGVSLWPADPRLPRLAPLAAGASGRGPPR